MMKKILLTAAINASVIFAAITVNLDNSALALSTDRYIIGGYSNADSTFSLTSGGARGASFAAESTDVFADANGNNDFVFASGPSWKSWTISSAYTKNITLSGLNARFKYGLSVSGTGTFTWPTNLYFDSTGFLFNVASTAGAQTTTNTNILIGSSGTVTTTKLMQNFKSLTIASNSSVLFNTGLHALWIASTNTIPVVIGDNCKVTIDAGWQITRAQAGIFITLGANDTITGTGGLSFNCGNGNDTMPALTTIGTHGAAGLSFTRMSGSGALVFTGDISALNATMINFTFATGTRRNIVYLKGNSLSTKVLRFGTSIASDTTEVHLSTATHAITGLDVNSSVVGSSRIYLDSSTINCSTYWWINSNGRQLVYPGISTVNFIGSTSTKIGHSNQHFYNVNIIKTNGAIDSLADSTVFYVDNNLTITSGVFKQKGDTIVVGGDVSILVSTSFDSPVRITGDLTITSGKLTIGDAAADTMYANDVTFNNTADGDSVVLNAPLVISGHYNCAAGVKIKGPGKIIFTSGVSHNVTSNGAKMPAVECKAITFLDSCHLQKLTLSDSAVVTLLANSGLKLDTIGDLSGSAGKLIRLASTVAGTQARVYIPTIDTVEYTRWQDINSPAFAIYAIDGTSVNGGGNTNIVFPAATRQNKRRGFGFMWGGFRF